MRVGPRVVRSVVAAAVVVAAAFGVGVVSGLIERDGGFQIDRFVQHVTVHADGTTEVVEELEVSFSSERRGIFRDLDVTTPASRSAPSATTSRRRSRCVWTRAPPRRTCRPPGWPSSASAAG